MKRGGSVEIPLRIYGTRAQTLSWIIKQPPLRGKLSAIRATGAESAVVTYRPPADLRIVSERFTISVRSTEGVSAPVEMTIGITDDAPQIGGPAELDFGEVLLGATAAKTFEFSNGGGGVAEGTFEVSPPWKIESARSYKLAAGEKQSARIVFAPERAGKFESEVRFTSQPDRAVILQGVAEEPLAVKPAKVVLSRDAGQPLRAAFFEIRNNTGQPLDVAIAASLRLIVKSQVHLAARTAAAVAVQTAETDAAKVDETIALTAGEFSARLPVTGAAIPVSTASAPPSVAALPEEASTLPVVPPAPRRVSTPAAKRREDPVESDAPHFGPFAATVDSVSANSATFHWQDDVPADTEYRCLQRTLSVDEDGELVPAFHDYSACKFVKRDGANTATVEKLEPGKSYLFRIDAGSSAVTFAQIRTPSPPVSEHHISLVYVLFTLAVIACGISIWQRVRPRSGF